MINKNIKEFNLIVLIYIGIILSYFPTIYCQTNIQGTISSYSEAVKYASVNFINVENNISYSTITDSSGYYQLNILTSLEVDPIIPKDISLGQNYPNPFSSETSIPFKLNKPAEISIKIYNLLGQEIKSFNAGEKVFGIHRIIWDGKNNFGQKVSSGIYFYQLQASKETIVKKMIFNSSELNLKSSFIVNFKTDPEKKVENNYLNIKSGTYTIQITSNDSTSPRISPFEIKNVHIQSDTVINLNSEVDTTALRILLEKESDHSGIMVKIAELDTFVITDSNGTFVINRMDALGDYTIIAKYPYFKPKEINVIFENGKISSPIEIELKQLMQFLVDPAETTISKSNLGHLTFFSIEGFWQWRVNISNEPVGLITTVGPREIFAIAPLDNEWPDIPNPDNLPYCYDHYNWFGGNDMLSVSSMTFQPGDTSSIYMETDARKDCFLPGNYLIYSAFSDLGHYPEYFTTGADANEGIRRLYKKMNRSIFTKLNLFRPARVKIIE